MIENRRNLRIWLLILQVMPLQPYAFVRNTCKLARTEDADEGQLQPFVVPMQACMSHSFCSVAGKLGEAYGKDSFPQQPYEPAK